MISRTLTRLFSSTPNPKISANPKNSIPSNSQQSLRSLIKSLILEPDLNLLISNFTLFSASPKFRTNPKLYKLIIHRLTSAGRLDAVDQIIQQHKLYQHDISKEGFAARLISLYGIARMPDRAAALFYELPALGLSPTVFSFNAVLTAYARSDDADPFARIQDFFASTTIEPDGISYNILINALLERGVLDDAIGILDLMERRGVKPNLVTFNTLMSGFYRRGMILKGDEVWKRMEGYGIQPNLRSFDAKIRAFCSQGKISEAMQVFEGLGKIGLEPDIMIFNALIEGYCREEKLEEAKMLYNEMGKKGCVPNKYTLRELVPKLCRGGEIGFALDICKMGIENGFDVDVGIVQVMIDELGKASLYDKAKQLVKRAKLMNTRANFRMPLSCLGP